MVNRCLPDVVSEDLKRVVRLLQSSPAGHRRVIRKLVTY